MNEHSRERIREEKMKNKKKTATCSCWCWKRKEDHKEDIESSRILCYAGDPGPEEADSMNLLALSRIPFNS